MNDAVIIAVANAITANAEVLKSLIDSLPKATKQAVETKVAKITPAPAPVAIPETATAHVEVPATPVVPVSTTPPVVVAPTPAPAPVGNGMPPPPFPQNPAPTPAAPPQAMPQSVSVSTAPVSASPSNVPFNDHKTMLKYVMDSYQALGNVKGAQIQGVLGSIGVHNINDVKPEQYAALYAGVEALKVGS
jgi:hypothetical protein